MSSDKENWSKTEKDRKNIEKENNTDESDFSENEIPDLTILKWKNLRSTGKIHWNTRLAVSDVFHMFTQSIKLF